MMKLCEMCKQDYKAKAPNQKYCDICRPLAHRQRNVVYFQKKLKARRQAERKERASEVAIEQKYQDLAFDIVRQAFRPEDVPDTGQEDEPEDTGVVFRGGDYFWLAEFGMEFLSYSGNPINQRKFDGLMEEMNGNKETT